MTSSELTKQWVERVSCLKVAHYQSAGHFERRNALIGGILIFMTAAVTTLTTLRLAYPNLFLWWHLVIAVAGLLSTVLAGLQTFFRWSERAEKHRTAGATYARLELQLEKLRSFEQEADEKNVDDFYD